MLSSAGCCVCWARIEASAPARPYVRMKCSCETSRRNSAVRGAKLAGLFARRACATKSAMSPTLFSVTALENLLSPKHARYDLGLFFAPNGGHKLCEDSLVPVAHLDLLARVRSGDLLTRLTDSTWIGDWRLWSAASGQRLTFGTSVTHAL